MVGLAPWTLASSNLGKGRVVVRLRAGCVSRVPIQACVRGCMHTAAPTGVISASPSLSRSSSGIFIIRWRMRGCRCMPNLSYPRGKPTITCNLFFFFNRRTAVGRVFACARTKKLSQLSSIGILPPSPSPSPSPKPNPARTKTQRDKTP